MTVGTRLTLFCEEGFVRVKHLVRAGAKVFGRDPCWGFAGFSATRARVLCAEDDCTRGKESLRDVGVGMIEETYCHDADIETEVLAPTCTHWSQYLPYHKI